MTRWRRPGADEILLAYMLLAVIGYAVNWLDRGHGGQSWPLGAFASTAFLVWRVSRGGWLSRRLLIIASGASYAYAALARSGGLAAVALFFIYGVQIALLFSPPLFGRTRRPAIQVRARGWVDLIRLPPAWLLPWGLFAGAVVTVAFLGNLGFVGLAGCTPPASAACTAVAQGYPVHWLTANQGAPLIWVWLTEPDGLPG